MPPTRAPNVPPGMIARIVDVLHPRQVWLFGSRARGMEHPNSDWDFMAVLADEAPADDLEITSVWKRLRDLRVQRVEVFTITHAEFEEWRNSLGTLAKMGASICLRSHGG